MEKEYLFWGSGVWKTISRDKNQRVKMDGNSTKTGGRHPILRKSKRPKIRGDFLLHFMPFLFLALLKSTPSKTHSSSIAAWLVLYTCTSFDRRGESNRFPNVIRSCKPREFRHCQYFSHYLSQPFWNLIFSSFASLTRRLLNIPSILLPIQIVQHPQRDR